jgi:hypothetical protein
LPAVPWLSRFGEVYVRTYVHDRHGRSGIWFFSLDAARLPAVLAARAGYWLPYFWSDVSVRVSGDWLGYRCRRLPGHRARCNAEVTMRVPLAEAERDELGLDQDLLRRAGLPPPAGDPLAHASPGVPVRIGMWHCYLMAQDQQLGILRRRRACQQRHPPGQADEDQVQHPYGHEPAILPAARPTGQAYSQFSRRLCPFLERYKAGA